MKPKIVRKRRAPKNIAVPSEITTCPERKEYKFCGKCGIRTCQFNTLVTARGCLALDRKETSDRTISLAEILHYKKGLIPESDVKPEQLVKRYTSAARNVIALYFFICYIADFVIDRSYVHVEGQCALSDSVNAYLSSIQEYRSWMLPHVADIDLFSAFLKNKKALAYSDVSLAQALNLTTRQFVSFSTELEQLIQQKSGDTHVQHHTP